MTEAITRHVVASYVAAAFDSPPVERAGLIKCALDAHAPGDVLDVLHSLPPRSYTNMRDLWPELAHLPVE